MKIKTVIAVVFALFTVKMFSQPIQDKWDTLVADVTYTYVVNEAFYFQQKSNVVTQNKMLMFGDSIHKYNGGIASYLRLFDPSTNTITTINFPRVLSDHGLSAGLAKGTNTPNLTYSYFGVKNDYEISSDELTIYKHNSLTNTVSSETINIALQPRAGIINMCFFSPTSNHDSLIIFNEYTSGGGQVDVYKKHYLQNGITNYSLTLPFTVYGISSSIVYNNTFYMCIDNGSGFDLISSTDGLNFNVNNTYSLSYANYKIADMDTLNGVLYLGLYDSGQDNYNIVKTTNGNTFVNVYPSNESGEVLDLIKHKKRIWTAKKDPNFNILYQERPIVNYVGGPLLNSQILSQDTVGRSYNKGISFKLNEINNKLYLTGNYVNNDIEAYGTFVYRLREPVAVFSPTTQQICLNSPFTLTSNSVNADSVRWIKDNNFFAAANQTTYPASFNTIGQHTLGLMAITGTQIDTMLLVVNVYSISLNTSIAANACLNLSTTLNATVTGNQGATNYSWTVLPATQTGGTNSIVANFTPSVAGTYSVSFTVTDAQNCSASSSINLVNINSNKDVTGVATNSGSPVAGIVVLYKYEPVLTKFDSITYQTIDALGNYTFSAANPSSYILKCVPTATNLQSSYANSSIGWKSATVLYHGCVTNTIQNINVIALTNLGTGPGVLSGKVLEGLKYGQKGAVVSPGGPVRGISIKCGRNPGGDAIAQGTTDPSGQYYFSNLPLNGPGESYFILVDIPGLDTNGTYHKVITAGTPTFIDLDFVADSAKINPGIFIGVKEITNKYASLKLYPNPTSGIINIEFEFLLEPNIEIVVTNILGKEVYHSSQIISDKKTEMNLQGMNEGVYFLNIKIGEEYTRTKIVLTNP